MSFDDDYQTSVKTAAPSGAPSFQNGSTSPQAGQVSETNQPQTSSLRPDKNGNDWTSVAAERASAHNVPVELQLGLINHESGGNPYAKNAKSSAFGLGQQTDANWSDYLKRNNLQNTDRNDPYNQADATADDLSLLYKKFGSWRTATMAYYAGAGLMDKAVNGKALTPAEAKTLGEADTYANTIGAHKFDPNQAVDNADNNQQSQQPQSGSFDSDYVATVSQQPNGQTTTQPSEQPTNQPSNPDDNRPWFPEVDFTTPSKALGTVGRYASEEPLSMVTAVYDTGAGLLNLGKAGVGYVKGLVGGDSSYTPTPMLEERKEDWAKALTPSSTSGQLNADIMPFLVPGGEVGEVANAGKLGSTVQKAQQAIEKAPYLAREVASNLIPSASGVHTGSDYAKNLGLNTAAGVVGKVIGKGIDVAYDAFTKPERTLQTIQDNLDELGERTIKARQAADAAAKDVTTAKGNQFESDYRAAQAKQKADEARKAYDDAVVAHEHATNLVEKYGQSHARTGHAVADAAEKYQAARDAVNSIDMSDLANLQENYMKVGDLEYKADVAHQQYLEAARSHAHVRDAHLEAQQKLAEAERVHTEAQARQASAEEINTAATQRAQASRDAVAASQDRLDAANKLLRHSEQGVGFTQQQYVDIRDSVKQFAESNEPWKIHPDDSKSVRFMKDVVNSAIGTSHGIEDVQKVIGKDNILFRPTEEGGYGIKMSDLEETVNRLDRVGLSRFASALHGWGGIAKHMSNDVQTVRSLHKLITTPEKFAQDLGEHARNQFKLVHKHLKSGNFGKALDVLERPNWGPDAQPLVNQMKRLMKAHKAGNAKQAYVKMVKNLAIAAGTEYAMNKGIEYLGGGSKTEAAATATGLGLMFLKHRAANKQLQELDKILSTRYVMPEAKKLAVKAYNAIEPYAKLIPGMAKGAEQTHNNDKQYPGLKGLLGQSGNGNVGNSGAKY